MFHYCRACDVKWHGEPKCWSCDREVTAWGAAKPKKKESHERNPSA